MPRPWGALRWYCLTSVAYIRSAGGVSDRLAGWRVLADRAQPAWLKSAAARFRCRPVLGHIVAAAHLQLVYIYVRAFENTADRMYATYIYIYIYIYYLVVIVFICVHFYGAYNVRQCLQYLWASFGCIVVRIFCTAVCGKFLYFEVYFVICCKFVR